MPASPPSRIARRAVFAQFVKYGLVGMSNTVLSLAIYAGLVALGLWYVAAYAIGYAIGVANSYLINRRWTFMASSTGVTTALRYFLVQAAGGIASTVLIYILVDGAGLGKIPAQLIAIGTAVVLTFAVNRTWTFGDAGGGTAGAEADSEVRAGADDREKRELALGAGSSPR